ncbi:MAG TPA: tetratricopeptide repeat protein [Thermoanaerobaculia bacterium]|nr:tetratricopeptide repeat protein [Thermoanaerobaculia bacterium]
MNKHPISLEVLGRFASHSTTAAERRAVVRHLLAGCAECKSQLGHLLPSPPEMDRRSKLQDDRYDAAFERAVRFTLTAFQGAPAARVQGLLAEIDATELNVREGLLKRHPRFWSQELCNALIQRSHEARFTDPAIMRHEAHLAVLVADCLSDDPLEPGEAAEFRARAWAALGNALRVSGDLNDAEGALLTAQSHLKNGTRQRPHCAQVLSHLASLRMDQRRFEDSLDLIQQAVEIWRDLGNDRELARALIKQAIMTGEAGKPRAAVHILKEAGKLVDAKAEPKLALILMHSIIRFYVDGGQSEVALRLHLEARPLYEQESDPLIRIKERWLEGQILSAERHLESALKQLSEAREGYLAHGNRYEAAIVSLDLAAVFAKLRRFPEMRVLAREILREMEALGVRRESLAALILLQQAATSEAALTLIRRTASAIKAPPKRPRLSDGRPGIEPLFL